MTKILACYIISNISNNDDINILFLTLLLNNWVCTAESEHLLFLFSENLKKKKYPAYLKFSPLVSKIASDFQRHSNTGVGLYQSKTLTNLVYRMYLWL